MEAANFIKKLHVRDIICLVTVLTRIKPIANIIVPREIIQQFTQFCENKGLILNEDGPRDQFQTRITISNLKEKVKLKKEIDKLSSFIRQKRNVQNMKPLDYGICWLNGVLYDYPECCIQYHAEKGSVSRLRPYEDFLASNQDQSIPIEFWVVAHSPCSSRCKETMKLGRKYLSSVNKYSQEIADQVESNLLLPRFYQTGGGRFIEFQPLKKGKYQRDLRVSEEQLIEKAGSYLPKPVKTVLCNVKRPFVLVDVKKVKDKSPYKTAFPNPDMIGIMWLVYNPGYGAYMINARTGKLALNIISDEWIPRIGEKWKSKSNFRMYKSKK